MPIYVYVVRSSIEQMLHRESKSWQHRHDRFIERRNNYATATSQLKN